MGSSGNYCPDHLHGPATVNQLKSATNRPLKSQKREAMQADIKAKMVKSAQVGH